MVCSSSGTNFFGDSKDIIPFRGGNRGSNPLQTTILRDGAAVARRAHNPKVRGSNPLPATKSTLKY